MTTHRGAAAPFFSPLTSVTGPGTVFSLVVVLCFRPWLSARHLSQESAGTNISVAGTFELSESLLTICLGRSSCHFLLSLLLSAHWGYVTCAPASCWPCLSAWASLFFFCLPLFLCQTKFVSMSPVLTARLCFQVYAQRSKGLRYTWLSFSF